MYAVSEGCPVALGRIRTSKREESGQLERISRLRTFWSMIKKHNPIFYYQRGSFFFYFKIEIRYF